MGEILLLAMCGMSTGIPVSIAATRAAMLLGVKNTDPSV